jgi:predicted ATP-dependent serine protease
MELLEKPEGKHDLIQKHKSVKVKALSAKQVVNKKRIIYPFEGKWRESFGQPERFAKWFITGPPGSGKSSFIYELCSYLIQFGNKRIDYNSHEEGDSQTTADKIERYGLAIAPGFKVLDKVATPLWKQRLLNRQSASFGVMDSLQHGNMNKNEYREFVRDLCNTRKGKSLIFISHNIKDGYTLFVKHDCDIKIECRGFIAKPDISRYGGNKPFVIWEKGARKFWGKKYNSVVSGNYWPGQKK